MYVCAEELPIEIWLMIFRYLEAHDLFQAFQNLNSHFDQILASNYLSFYLRLKKSDYNHRSNVVTSYCSDSILNRIISLEAATQYQPDYFHQFLHYYAHKLFRLQCMRIKIRLREIRYICPVLKELHFLEYLFLTCAPNQMLLETILSISTLRRCRLVLWDSKTYINYNSGINSNIQKLSITFLKQSYLSIINLCLIHMPKLKKLEISCESSYNDQVSFSSEQLFILPELQMFKLKVEYIHFKRHCFNYLTTTMPALQQIHFDFTCCLADNFIEYFIYHFWPIIENIGKINIFIKINIDLNTKSNSTQTKLETYRQILLDKNNQIDRSFQITWEEKLLSVSKLVTITIVKS